MTLFNLLESYKPENSLQNFANDTIHLSVKNEFIQKVRKFVAYNIQIIEMKNIHYCILAVITLLSCQSNKEISSVDQANWEKRKAQLSDIESLIDGKTYLPVYSQIYQQHEHKTYDLTVTVSIRNVSAKDTVYILKADYNNTNGKRIRSYFMSPIYLTPLETIEIVIDEIDKEGGTGGNFMFEWAVKDEKNLPLFEAVMISTTGQQGLSFTTRGIRIFD